MNKGNIAIITDSSCDLPAEYIRNKSVYILPLRVNFPEGSFRDGVDILPEEVYARMPDETPTTSQPTPDDVRDVLDRVLADGYGEAVAICLTSAMSGTFNLVSMCAKEETALAVHVVETHRLSMAHGLLVAQAVEMNEQGKTAQEIADAITAGWQSANNYFCLSTLNT
jgi:DegV family protein with EDD domain